MPNYVPDPTNPGKQVDVIELQRRNPYQALPPVLIKDWLKHDLWTRQQAIQLLADCLPDKPFLITNPKRYLDGTSDIQLSPLMHPLQGEILASIMTLSNWAGLSEANETKHPQEWLAWAKGKRFTPYWLDYAEANQSAPNPPLAASVQVNDGEPDYIPLDSAAYFLAERQWGDDEYAARFALKQLGAEAGCLTAPCAMLTLQELTYQRRIDSLKKDNSLPLYQFDPLSDSKLVPSADGAWVKIAELIAALTEQPGESAPTPKVGAAHEAGFASLQTILSTMATQGGVSYQDAATGLYRKITQSEQKPGWKTTNPLDGVVPANNEVKLQGIEYLKNTALHGEPGDNYLPASFPPFGFNESEIMPWLGLTTSTEQPNPKVGTPKLAESETSDNLTPKNKLPQIWWRIDYDIMGLAQSAGDRLRREGGRTSNRSIGDAVALEIEKREKVGKRRKGPDGQTIKNTNLKGWKYLAE